MQCAGMEQNEGTNKFPTAICQDTKLFSNTVYKQNDAHSIQTFLHTELNNRLFNLVRLSLVRTFFIGDTTTTEI